MDVINEIDLSSNKKCATVSFIKSPSSFWVRLDDYQNEYIDMVKQIQIDYENADESDFLSVKNLALGSLCCVFNQKLFEWQRCEIIRINQNEISIFYIDIGAADLVSIKSIRTLHDCYKTIHRFALHCSLDNLKPADGNIWKTPVITRFDENVLFKIVTLTFKSKSENIYNVDMFLKSQNIAELLISDGFAIHVYSNQNKDIKPDNDKIKTDLQATRFIKAASIPLSDLDEYVIEVTCIYSPFCFYAQLSQNKEKFSAFEEALQEYYENEKLKNSEIILLKKPRIGQMCIAKYSIDDAWYRAVVKEIDLDLNSVVVFFIDYGNHETVQIDGNLLVINESLVKFPCMGIMCCLDGIKPIIDSNRPDSVTEDVVNLMYDSMSFKVVAKFLDKLSNDCYMVSVEVEERVNEKSKMINLAEILIMTNHVMRNGKPRISQLEPRKPLKRKSITPSVSENNLKNKPAIAESKLEHQLVFKKYSSNELVLEKAGKYDITITHVETICEFYVMINHNITKEKDEFRALLSDIQYFYERKQNLPQPLYQLHNACVYYDSEKKRWHRAQIINILDNNNCVIYLIDVGERKFVNRTQLRDIYEKYLVLGSQVAQASLFDLKDQKADEIDEYLQAKFKDIALGKYFLSKVIGVVNSESKDHILKHKYLLNLFDDSYESVFTVLTQDINHSLVSENFKPNIKSKLEETNISINNETLDESYSLISTNQANVSQQAYNYRQQSSNKQNGHDYRKQSIDDDITSPFPKHDHSSVKPVYDQTDFARPPSKTRLTLIEAADKLEQFEKKPEFKINYYDIIQIDTQLPKPFLATISYFENCENFSAQFVDLFFGFDQYFDEFQESCKHSKTVDPDSFKMLKNLNIVSIAAKFYDDALWYRARIVDTNSLAADGKCLVEFIDYGNRQLTLLSDCVFLNEKFSKFRPCAVQCAGLAYLSFKNSKLTNENIENLLYYGKIVLAENDDPTLKYEWSTVYFMKKNDKIFIEIDELYSVFYKLKLIDSNHSFNPIEFNELICTQANKEEISAKMTADAFITFDGIVSDIEDGLQFIYLILKQSLEHLKRLETELKAQPIESLVKLSVTDLVVNKLYLVKYNKSLYRCKLLTPLSGKFNQIQLIDYGKKITYLTEQELLSVEFFVLMPKYFKYPTFVIHCRLPYASSIEKVWLLDEKQKFYRSIQPQKEYRIRLLSAREPYVIEFRNDLQNIDFQFNSIIARINQNELEPQTVLNGNSSVSLNENFYLGGVWLKKNNSELNIFFEQGSLESAPQESLYLYSKNLLEEFKFHYSSLETTLKPLSIDTIKKGDLILFKRKSKAFLDNLKDDIRPLIENDLSRVRVKSISTCKTTGNRTFSLFYCDYGFTDFLQVSSSQTITSNKTSTDYELYAMTLQSKLWRLFTFECNLSKQEIAKKLIKAKDRNDFIDAFYLNGVISRMFASPGSTLFKVDFTQSLHQLHYLKQIDSKTANIFSSNIFTVNLIDAADDKSLIDKIIDYGLKDISNHSFLCVITHMNHLNNFYVQKFDEANRKLLDELQESIQNKVASNQLSPLKSVELNKLCIAFYDDDQQYYRAKIINFSQNDKKIEVFYIDFGNSSKIEFNQIREITPDLIERMPRAFSINCELDVSQLNLNTVEIEELNNFLNEIVESDYKFDVKFVSRKANKYNDTSCYIIQMFESERKLSIYEMFKHQKNSQIPETSNVNFRFSDSIDVSSEDDKALAESLTVTTSNFIDDTDYGNNTLASVSKSFIPDHLDPSWHEPHSKAKANKIPESACNKTKANLNYEANDSTLHASIISANQDPSWVETPSSLKYYDNSINTTINTTFNQTALNGTVANQDPSWVETPSHLKYYDYSINTARNESIISCYSKNDLSQTSLLIVQSKKAEINLETNNTQADNTLNESDLDADEAEDRNEFYSTANATDQSIIFRPNNLSQDETTYEKASEINFEIKTNETIIDNNSLLIKKCLVSFLNSSQSFYLQEEDFQEKMAAIQPEIEECFDPFDTSLSNLCIGQWANDEQFYRMRLLDWLDESNPKALCVFIDYGNTEYILKDTITAMSDKLQKIMPLAIHCKLYTNIDNKPKCFHNLEELVTSEMIFDAVIESRTKLDEFYRLQMNEKSKEEFEPVNVRLYLVDRRDFEINEQTLGQEEWPTILNHIKTEPLSILIADDSNRVKNSDKKNCLEYGDKIITRRNNEDDDNDRQKNNIFKNSNQSIPLSQNYNIHTNINTGDNINNSNYSGKQNLNTTEIEDDQAAIDEFVRDQEKEDDKLETNKPEAFMYTPNKNYDEENSELPSLREDPKLVDNSTNTTKINDSKIEDSICSNVDETYNSDKHFRNETVDKFNESSHWTNETAVDVTVNEVKTISVTLNEFNQTIDNKNLTVSRFHDENSNWTTNQDETVIPKILDDSFSAQLNASRSDISNVTIVNKNETVSEFHDQNSNWEPNVLSTSTLDQTNDNKNMTISRLPDESTWTVNNDKSLNNSNVNLTVEEFNDQDSNWIVNQSQLSGFKEILDEDNKNLTISRMADETQWSSSETVSESPYLSKTITESNVSLWQSDINQSIFDSREKKLNRKLNVEDETPDESERVKYTRFVDGFVMRVNSFEDFYIQIEDADVQLMNMKTDLEECRKLFEKIPQLGTICVAPYHIDNQFYRAQIIEIDKGNINYALNNPNSSFNTSVNKYTDPKVKVHYIDYGNEEFVDLSEMYKITLELKNIAPLALNCRLNLSKKLKNWIKKMSDLKQDVLPELQKCFKRLTSRSKLKLKIIKETNFELKNGDTVHIRPPSMLVDAFLGDENICDSLLVNTIISFQPNSQMPDLRIIENKEKDFDGYLINFKHFDKSAITGFEISIQNQSVLKLIDDLFQNFNNLNDCSSQNLEENIHGPFCFAPLPEKLVDNYLLKNGYGRVAIIDKITKPSLGSKVLNKNSLITSVLVHFIDFDFKCWIDNSELMIINNYLSQIQSSVEKFNLNLTNLADLSSLNNIQFKQLNEIFKMLINYNEIELKNSDKDSQSTYCWSSRFKTIILTKNSNVFSTINKEVSNFKTLKSCVIDSVRLYDTEREMLDINRIMEMCVSIMSRPFVGHISNIESDFSQFECVNVASSFANLNELQKLYRSTGYFNNETSPEPKIRTNYKVGQLCLVNEKSEKPESVLRKNSSESILSLNGHTNDNLDETNIPAEKSEPFKRGYFRGIIIDESAEKCVVLNVDNGKKMTLSKKRIQVMNDICSNKSRTLINLIPFMLIKARPKSPITDSNLKRILSNSRFYLETIKLNIIGSWSNSESRPVINLPSDSTENFHEFIQSEKDLNKIIELIFENSNNTEIAQLEADPTNKISSISIKNSFHCKRKRDDEFIEQSEYKITKDIEAVSKDGFCFKLSHVKSLNCFYLQSTESIKTIGFIEEQIQIEHLENNRLSKMNRKDHKLDTIYGIYSEKEKKYFRILLKSRPYISQNQIDYIYNAFYLDYGYSGQVNSQDLIFISEYVQQFAPQAICCKLQGFLTLSKSNFADADITEVSNETNVSCLSNYENYNDFESNLETEMFIKLLHYKPFMATVYKRFSYFKKIENIVPLQTDNYLKPIEIVIHLFEKAFNDNVVDELESRSVTYYLKRMLDENKKGLPKKNFQKFNLRKHANIDNELMMEFGNLINPNQFFLHLPNWTEQLNELTKRMERDYNEKSYSLEKVLNKGSYCAYVEASKGIYKRAKINELSPKYANIYLIDTGEHIADVSLDKIFNLFDLYYDFEPLCFECTLGLQYTKNQEDKYANKFKTLIQLSKFFKVKLIEDLHPTKDKTVYLVNLFGSRASQKETDRSYTMNISDELKTNNPVLLLSVSSPTSKVIDHVPNSDVDHNRKHSDLKKCIAFKESEIPLNEILKIQLTIVDTVKHFGIVLNSDLESRYLFLKDFHQWHKENKKNLRPVFSLKSENNENRSSESQIDKKQCNKPSFYIGMPCAINSIQIGKWCRGVITLVDFSSQMTLVYLVDYCRTVQVATDRIFKIDKKEHLEEPIYAHRCQLVDDPQQRFNFEKYLNLLKGSIQPTATLSKGSNNSDKSQESLNSSHIAMENIEIFIICLSKTSTVLNQMTILYNDQYTINVIDFRRIRTSFHESPYLRIKGHQPIGFSPLSNNNSPADLRKYTNDSTTENILSTNFKENSLNHVKNTLNVDFNSISSNNSFNNQLTRSSHKANFLNIEGEQSIMNYTNDTSFTNFSAITESTRITPYENNTDDDITQTNEQTVVTISGRNTPNNNQYNNYKNIVDKCRSNVDKREETSNWVKDLDNLDEQISYHLNEIEPDGPKIRVRIVPNSFNPSDFICQKLDLLSAYDHLQLSMNDYYEKTSNNIYQNATDNVFVDSLEGEKSLFSEHQFKMSDFCAAKLGKSWVRCKIIDIEANKQAFIECVDDFRKLRVHLNKLEKLNSEFRKMPRLAFKCRLANLDSAKLFTINQNAIEKFKTIISTNNKELIAEVVSSKQENLCRIYEVNLFINDKDILEFLKEISS